MPDIPSYDISRIADAIFSEGDLLATAKMVEIAVMLSDKKDTVTITKNIDNVAHFMKVAISKLDSIKKANR